MKKIINNNLFMLKIFYKAVPMYATCFMLFIVLRSLLFSLFGNVLFIQYLVKSVEYVLQNPQQISTVLVKLIIVTCIYYGFVLLLNTVIEGIFNNSLTKKAEIKVNQTLTKLLFEKSVTIDIAYYDSPEYYNNLVVANSEANRTAWNTYRNFVNLTENTIVLLSLFAVISSLDFVVFLLALLINIISFLYQIKLNKINGEVYNLEVPHKKEIDYVNRIFFLKQNAKDMKVTSVNKIMFGKLEHSSEKLSEIYAKYGLKRAVWSGFEGLTKRVVGDFFTLFYLAYMVLVRNVYSFDVMAALWNSYSTIKGNMNNCVNAIKELHNNSIYIGKVIDFLKLENHVVSNRGLKSNENEPVSITFKDVSFSYDKENYILDGLNLTINANEKVAIVGNNGAGKSTLVKLLLRLYDPDKGNIFVNGIDIRDYDLEFYRKHICSTLVQNFQLFALSLYENVKMDVVDGKMDCATLDKVLAEVGLQEKISQFTERGNSSYSKEFDNNGVVFSGGQKQKLALGRVLFSDSKLIILDEPSSAMDPKAESEFNELVFNTFTNKTVIIISHRLSTTKMADRIILIDNGRVAEDGPHEILIKNNAKYAQMFELQSRRYK